MAEDPFPTLERVRNRDEDGGTWRNDGGAPPRCPSSRRVIVVSDVLLYREGVATGLASLARFVVLGALGTAEALRAVERQRPDAALIDAAGATALTLARQLRRLCPATALVGFGIASDIDSLACAEAGLTGFVGRDGTIADLAAAAEAALAGEVGCSPRFAALLCERLVALSGAKSPPFGNRCDPGNGASGLLTRREREIAELASDGLSNKEIAIELAIGPATVKNHIHNILEKLDLPRRGAIGARLRALPLR